jgi:hypothetical protein
MPVSLSIIAVQATAEANPTPPEEMICIVFGHCQAAGAAGATGAPGLAGGGADAGAPVQAVTSETIITITDSKQMVNLVMDAS